jgi:predicted transcriptional regulator of viral defense system
MKIQTFFLQNPIFSYQDFLKFLNAHGTRKHDAQNAALKYYLKTGGIIHLRRELYAVISPLNADNAASVDVYLLASKLTSDAILAYHTALELHGAAYSVFEDFTYISDHPLRPFQFNSHVFRGIFLPKNLLDKRKGNFGVISMKREGVDVRVTSLARTIVDVLARPELAGGWEEVWRSLESIAVFDVAEAVKYVQLLDNATLAAKLGFFLDQRSAALAVDSKHLKQLLKMIPSKPHYLERNRRRSGKVIARWNLVVPNEILSKTWEEPHEDV